MAKLLREAQEAIVKSWFEALETAELISQLEAELADVGAERKGAGAAAKARGELAVPADKLGWIARYRVTGLDELIDVLGDELAESELGFRIIETVENFENQAFLPKGIRRKSETRRILHGAIGILAAALEDQEGGGGGGGGGDKGEGMDSEGDEPEFDEQGPLAKVRALLTDRADRQKSMERTAIFFAAISLIKFVDGKADGAAPTLHPNGTVTAGAAAAVTEHTSHRSHSPPTAKGSGAAGSDAGTSDDDVVADGDGSSEGEDADGDVAGEDEAGIPDHFWAKFLRGSAAVAAAPHHVWLIHQELNQVLDDLDFELAPLVRTVPTEAGAHGHGHGHGHMERRHTFHPGSSVSSSFHGSDSITATTLSLADSEAARERAVAAQTHMLEGMTQQLVHMQEKLDALMLLQARSVPVPVPVSVPVPVPVSAVGAEAGGRPGERVGETDDVIVDTAIASVVPPDFAEQLQLQLERERQSHPSQEPPQEPSQEGRFVSDIGPSVPTISVAEHSAESSLLADHVGDGGGGGGGDGYDGSAVADCVADNVADGDSSIMAAVATGLDRDVEARVHQLVSEATLQQAATIESGFNQLHARLDRHERERATHGPFGGAATLPEAPDDLLTLLGAAEAKIESERARSKVVEERLLELEATLRSERTRSKAFEDQLRELEANVLEEVLDEVGARHYGGGGAAVVATAVAPGMAAAAARPDSGGGRLPTVPTVPTAPSPRRQAAQFALRAKFRSVRDAAARCEGHSPPNPAAASRT
jgi:hypothetical protein